MKMPYFFELISKEPKAYGLFRDGQELGIATVFTEADAKIITDALNVPFSRIRSTNISLLKDNQLDYDMGVITTEQYQERVKQINSTNKH